MLRSQQPGNGPAVDSQDLEAGSGHRCGPFGDGIARSAVRPYLFVDLLPIAERLKSRGGTLGAGSVGFSAARISTELTVVRLIQDDPHPDRRKPNLSHDFA
jgi:hypothetical protein